MPNTWILVADAARARLFESPRKGAEPVEIACYYYPDGRSQGRQHEHGRLPRVQESNNPNRHAIEPKTSLRDKHAQRFAEILGTVVQQGRREGRYARLVLVAPPRFLGALHDHLDEATAACIVGEVRRELMTLSPAELRAHLPR
ncbi:MAG: host attachment protein [Rhodanobacter sp.]